MIIHINILVHAVFQQIAAGDHAHTLESQLGVQLDRTVIALDNGIEDQNAVAQLLCLFQRVAHQSLADLHATHFRRNGIAGVGVVTASAHVVGVQDVQPKCDRAILSRAITLVESNAAAHFETAQQVIQKLLPYTGKSTRVGITGVPGAGKSTFIEALGTNLCRGGHKVAVLAVDPSSTVTKGSILGDKTRMEQLSREPNAFIRPSPSGGTLGGLTRKSRETLLLCEAAGYDTILVETVGVGQSETTVRSMVDFFLLVVLTGAGDELQGMKKGVMELADAIVVNKADGDNKQRAMITRAEYERILQFLRQATENWTTHAYTCSAYTGAGIMELWNDVIEAFMKQGWGNGVLAERRKQQTLSWVYTMLKNICIICFIVRQPLLAAKKRSSVK